MSAGSKRQISSTLAIVIAFTFRVSSNYLTISSFISMYKRHPLRDFENPYL
nr:MAG TPA: hypothetical protein [Caudoviricetes sp.]